MVYQDEDPDVQFRIAEALEMMDGTLESQSRSIYVGRIQHELSQAFPDRAFEVSLVRESIWVRPCDERERSYRMESPKLGFWIMSVAQGKGDKTLLEGASFMDCVYELIEREREQSEEER